MVIEIHPHIMFGASVVYVALKLQISISDNFPMATFPGAYSFDQMGHF